MKNEDLYRVKQGIDKCSAIVNVADINFAYTMAKIDNEVINELRALEKARKDVPDDYTKYTTEREQIDIDFAVQLSGGTYQMVNNKLLISNPKEHANKISKLKEKYKEVIDIVDKNNKEFEDFLLQESKVTITKLPKGCIPAQVNVEQMKLLFSVIE